MSVTSDNIAANAAAIANLQTVQAATLGILASQGSTITAQAAQIADLQASAGSGASQADLDAANAQLVSGTSAINSVSAGLPQPAPVVVAPTPGV